VLIKRSGSKQRPLRSRIGVLPPGGQKAAMSARTDSKAYVSVPNEIIENGLRLTCASEDSGLWRRM